MALDNPLWLQNLPYPARLDRQLIAALFTEGVLDPFTGALKVSQRAEGAAMSVDIAAGAAIIAGDDQPNQGRYLTPSTAKENRPITAAPAAGSRITTLVARVRDANVTGSFNDWVLEPVDGPVAAAGVTPTPPAVPNTALPLADVLVPAGLVSVTDGTGGTVNRITDRRTAAQAQTGVPRGVILLWSGSGTTIPPGWTLCDGTQGSPDLRDRFIVGAGGAYASGNTGGAASVTLSEAQIPGHNHAVGSAGDHTHGVAISSLNTTVGGEGAAAGVGGGSTILAAARAAGTHTHSSEVRGGGGSHENRPPYFALAYIMRL